MKVSLGLLVAIVLTLSACSSPTGDDTSTSPPTSSSTSQAPGTTATTTTTQSESGGITVEDALANWTVMAGPAGELLGGGALFGGQAAAIVTTDLGEAVVLGRPDGSTQIVHSPGSGWIVQQVLFVDGILVDVISNDSTGQSGLYVLQEGAEPTALEEWGSDLRHIPDVVAVGSSLIYTTRHVNDSLCLNTLDVNTSSTRELLCKSQGVDLGWLNAAAGGLSFVEWDGSECGRLMLLDLGGDSSPESVSGSACVFQGVSTTTAAAWVEPPTADAQGYVDFFAVPVSGVDDGELVSLGDGAAGSLTTCNGGLYWLWTGEGPLADEIRAWHPGQSIQVVYRSPDQGALQEYATSRPWCTDNHRVMIQRAGWQADAPDELLVLGEQGWALNLDGIAAHAPPDPESYLQALSDSPLLSGWAATQSEPDLVAFAETICDEMDNQSAPDRVGYIYDPETVAMWTKMASLSDPSQLWEWRQVATAHLCARHYQLMIGD